MCGRYYYDQKFIEEVSKLVKEISDSYKEGDIFPTDHAMVLAGADDMFKAHTMKWGFHGKDKNTLINARAETAMNRITFSDSVKNRRVLIPASGFYEWDRDKNKNTFTVPDSNLILMAGFYRIEEDGNHFMILTTDANETMRSVHDRMPLILTIEDAKKWLSENDFYMDILKQSSLKLQRKASYEQLSLFSF